MPELKTGKSVPSMEDQEDTVKDDKKEDKEAASSSTKYTAAANAGSAEDAAFAAEANDERAAMKEFEEGMKDDGGFPDEDKMAAAGRLGRTEHREGAKMEARDAKKWKKMTPHERALDARDREHFGDLVAAMKSMTEKMKWDFLRDETKGMKFPESWTRNNVFLNTYEEERRAQKSGLGKTGFGNTGEQTATSVTVASEGAGGANEMEEGEDIEEDGEGDEGTKAKKNAVVQGYDTLKNRAFMNVGLVPCRPIGKLGCAMSKPEGRWLSMLVNGIMATSENRAKMSYTHKDDWWWSSVTVNRGGITSVHCDAGNLGPSRLFCWGHGFIGGQTWVMAEQDEIDADPSRIEWVPTFQDKCINFIRNRGMQISEGTAEEKKPIRCLNMKTKKQFEATPDYLDEGGSLNNIALPFFRVNVNERVADFDGMAPHCTAPVFPASWKTDKSLWPESLQAIDGLNLEFAKTPEEAQKLLDASNNRPRDATCLRFVAVFYPHACSLPSKNVPASMKKAVGFGFVRCSEDFDKAREGMDTFRVRTNFYGQKLEKVGRCANYHGGKSYIMSEKQSDEIKEVVNRTKRKLGPNYKQPKDFVSGMDEEAEQNPLWVYDWVCALHGHDLSIRLTQLLQGNIKDTGEVAKKALQWSKQAAALKKAAEDAEAKEEDNASDDDEDGEGGSGKGKKKRTGLQEKSQQKRNLRGLMRQIEGRKLTWKEGKKSTNKELGRFPFRDWPQHWWFIKADQAEGIKVVESILDLRFGRIDRVKYDALIAAGSEKDEALLAAGWIKGHEPCELSVVPDKLELRGRFEFQRIDKPGASGASSSSKPSAFVAYKKTPKGAQSFSVKIHMTQRDWKDERCHRKLYTAFWGNYEKEHDSTFIPGDTAEELAEQQRIKDKKAEMNAQRKKEKGKGKDDAENAENDAANDEKPAKEKAAAEKGKAPAMKKVKKEAKGSAEETEESAKAAKKEDEDAQMKSKMKSKTVAEKKDKKEATVTTTSSKETTASNIAAAPKKRGRPMKSETGASSSSKTTIDEADAKSTDDNGAVKKAMKQAASKQSMKTSTTTTKKAKTSTTSKASAQASSSSSSSSSSGDKKAVSRSSPVSKKSDSKKTPASKKRSKDHAADAAVEGGDAKKRRSSTRSKQS
ncbi:unnamed protein product [Amoebophrya sp. A25]|nr:unnamed protein product [Amoebophrya sp. A25]|eukprot:GSA25T00015940001.1